MVRLHTRKGGKAKRSKKHYPRDVPSWLEMEASEVEAIVEKLAREGVAPAKIGVILRDSHAVPDVKALTGKGIADIMDERGIRQEYPADLLDLIKRAVRVRKHLAQNGSDVSNKERLSRVESKIRRLVKYYNRAGKLNNWKYKPDKAALLVR